MTGENAGLVLTSTTWNQRGNIYVTIDGNRVSTGVEYNKYCPLCYDNATVHSVTGCSNTADSQLLYYWLEQGYDLDLSVSSSDYFYLKEPDADGDEQEVCYYLNETPNHGEASVSVINDLLSGDISAKLTDGDFIAALNFYCGVKNHSVYGSSTTSYWDYGVYYDGSCAAVYKAAGFDSYYFIAAKSGKDTAKLFFTEDDAENFGYTDVCLSVFRENLDYGEVIRIGISGHAIYMDGYRFNDTSGEYEYHLNYGWGNTSYNNWYTVEALENEGLTYVLIDLSPDIKVEVSNASGEYCGGSFLRGVERINHIQNEKSTTFSFADEIAGKMITLDSEVDFTSAVDLDFVNWNTELLFTAAAGIYSANELIFDMDGGSIAVTAAGNDDYAVSSGERVEFLMDNSWLYAGNFGEAAVSVFNQMRSDGNFEIADFSDDFIASAIGYAVKSGDGDDILTLTGNSAVFGNIYMGLGENIITVESGSFVNGYVKGSPGSVVVNFLIDGSSDDAMWILRDQIMENGLLTATAEELNVDFAVSSDPGSYIVIDGCSDEKMAEFTVNITAGNETFSLGRNNLSEGDFSLLYSDGDLILKYAPERAVQIFTSGKLTSSCMELHSQTLGKNTSTCILNGGLVSDCMFSSGAVAEVNSGGTASNNKICSDAEINIRDGGFASNTIISGGRATVFSGGSARETYVLPGGVFKAAGEASATIISGGSMLVSGGSANTVSLFGGSMELTSGGKVTNAFVCSGGVMNVNSDAKINDAEIADGGKLQLFSGASANNTVVSGGGSMMVSNGGKASETIVASGGVMKVFAGGTASGGSVAGSMTVENGGSVSSSVVSGGKITVSSGAVAEACEVYSGSMQVHDSGTAEAVFAGNGGNIIIYSGGVVNGIELAAGGLVTVSSGGIITGTVKLGDGAGLFGHTGAILQMDIDPDQQSGCIFQGGGSVSGAFELQLLVDDDQQLGEYKLISGNPGFENSSFTIVCENTQAGSITVDSCGLYFDERIFRLCKTADSSICLLVDDAALDVSAGNAGIRWNDLDAAVVYEVELSTDNFNTVFRRETGNAGIDTWNMADGNYQWRVRIKDSGTWFDSEVFSVVSPENLPASQRHISDNDGMSDIFMARASGVWSEDYAAFHQGSLNGWNGTGERVELAGKNRFEDIFCGSYQGEAVLLLTDDANGDAFFLDDIYSAFPEYTANGESRFRCISEIRAGAGNDIIDLTSQRFAEIGTPPDVFGGGGDDIIWGGTSSALSGGAGNDRIIGGTGDDIIAGGAGDDLLHGGGGNDIFVFGGSWGSDRIEQTAGGSVTLWFESGSEDFWDAAGQVYVHDGCRVEVSGTKEISLVFGDDGSVRYDDIATLGVFDGEAASDIFEKKSEKLLA